MKDHLLRSSSKQNPPEGKTNLSRTNYDYNYAIYAKFFGNGNCIHATVAFKPNAAKDHEHARLPKRFFATPSSKWSVFGSRPFPAHTWFFRIVFGKKKFRSLDGNSTLLPQTFLTPPSGCPCIVSDGLTFLRIQSSCSCASTFHVKQWEVRSAHLTYYTSNQRLSAFVNIDHNIDHIKTACLKDDREGCAVS